MNKFTSKHMKFVWTNLMSLAFVTLTLAVQAQWINIYADQNLRGLAIINKDTVFATGYNEILRTTNGGLTWGNIMTIPIDSYSVAFANDSVGFVSGTNKVIKTTNGGNNWTVVKTANNSGFYNVYFPNISLGLVYSFEPTRDTIFRTTDAGQTWVPVFSRTSIRNFQLVDDNTGYLTHDSLFKTVDGGLTWNYVNVDTLFSPILNEIAFSGFVNANTGIIRLVDGSYLKTNDGGLSWEFLGVDILPPNYLGNFVSTDGINLYYYGWDFVAGSGEIYFSSDGGYNWDWQKSGLFNDLKFYNDTIGYAIDINNGVCKTIDGGFAGISEDELAKTNSAKFNFYPNPVADYINILSNTQISTNLELLIYNSHGELIYFNKLNQEKINTIRFDRFSEGIYFYSIRQGTTIFQRGKFLKIK